MPRKFAKEQIKTVTGPTQTLVSRIDHLHTLLRHLPNSLPENPSHSQYDFGLDPKSNSILNDGGGYFGAVGHILEVSFQTHLLLMQNRPLLFTERGLRLEAMVKLLKGGVKNMSPGERISFQERWIERLITGAIDSGAKITKKRKSPDEPSTESLQPTAKKSRQTLIIISDESESDESPAPPTASTSKKIPIPSSHLHSSTPAAAGAIAGNPKQSMLTALGWKKATPAETAAYWAKATEDGKERREQLLQSKQE
ncbi:hypothetical protein C8J57DRAFT_1516876 [Mycena rebaudengoi]|nr:hypothetical protein C8J57DRAFT_1516876 [Mycena rebaudengoi]